MAFIKGQEKKGGRTLGTPNKLTKTVKETVLEAFNEMQLDPKANILAWGKTNPAMFYQIAAKLIPTEVNANIEGNLTTYNVGFKKSEEGD